MTELLSREESRIKRDRLAFQELWNRIAKPELDRLVATGRYRVMESPDDAVWKCYCRFNLHCSENYMKDSGALLDRHKVAACFIYAFVKVSPIHPAEDEKRILALDEDAQLRIRTINEQFALMFGASILVAFLKKRANGVSAQCYEEMSSLLGRGIPFKDFTVLHGGSYEKNLAATLFYTKCEKTYNILQLADIIYFWELKTGAIDVLKRFDAEPLAHQDPAWFC